MRRNRRQRRRQDEPAPSAARRGLAPRLRGRAAGLHRSGHRRLVADDALPLQRFAGRARHRLGRLRAGGALRRRSVCARRAQAGGGGRHLVPAGQPHRDSSRQGGHLVPDRAERRQRDAARFPPPDQHPPDRQAGAEARRAARLSRLLLARRDEGRRRQDRHLLQHPPHRGRAQRGSLGRRRGGADRGRQSLFHGRAAALAGRLCPHCPHRGGSGACRRGAAGHAAQCRRLRFADPRLRPGCGGDPARRGQGPALALVRRSGAAARDLPTCQRALLFAQRARHPARHRSKAEGRDRRARRASRRLRLWRTGERRPAL